MLLAAPAGALPAVGDNSAHAFDRLLAGIGQIVYHDHVVSRLEQFNAGMAANESGTASHEDGFLIGHIDSPILHLYARSSCGTFLRLHVASNGYSV